MNSQLLLTLAPYLVPFLIGALVFVFKHFPSSPASAVSFIQHLVEAGVIAVEQSHPEMTGTQKKAAALATIQSLLAAAHVKADPVLIDTLLEAAVATVLPHSDDKPAPSTGLGFVR